MSQKEAIVKKLNNDEGVLTVIVLDEKFPSKDFKEGQPVTISKCLIREFNIRWWGFGFSCLAMGIILGIIIGMHI